MRIVLKGMTWSHPHGYDPMVACPALWERKSGVSILREKRSLQDFESFPVEELARTCDLIVIDHPHVGQITAEGCLAPLDVPGREPECAAITSGSVDQSFVSHGWQGRQWAFLVDAATQLQAWRPDLLAAVPTRWGEVLDLARHGRVLLPLRPQHSLMCFYTLAGNQGHPCATEGPGDLIEAGNGKKVIEMLHEITAPVDPACFGMDPVTVLEKMAQAGSQTACSPLICSYVSCATVGFRPNRLAFADMPVAGGLGPVGSAPGGTDIAVSTFSAVKGEAIDFTCWVAGADVQRSPYAAAGGQPGHAATWEDESVNAATSDFYKATRATLSGGWNARAIIAIMGFQRAASGRLNLGLADRHSASRIAAGLNRLFKQGFASTGKADAIAPAK